MRKFWLIVRMPTFTNDLDELLRRNRANTGFALEREHIPKTFYVSRESAIEACNRLASENPMKPYVVMAIDDIVETGQPTIIRKRFTDEGELVIV